MKVLHLDTNHPLLWKGLEKIGLINEADYESSKEKIAEKIHEYEGIIIRSRLPLDSELLKKATRLKFIGRVGAGLENIDVVFALKQNVFLAAAPEGNRNAVGEHTLGMLLTLLNKLNKADLEVRQGIWDREGNRGWELDGKTVGIIGYGNMGKAFARKLQGFDVEILCYDIAPEVGDNLARQVNLAELQQKSDVLSLHIPQTPKSIGMVNKEFIDSFQKPFWLLNTARGKCVVIKDLVPALRTGKVLGAGLDVLEYEKTSFEHLFQGKGIPEEFQYLIKANNVILTPHVAGWTVESKEKLAQTVLDKITEFLNGKH